MVYTLKQNREYMRAYRAKGSDKGARNNRMLTLPFVGFDGEGGDVENNYHAYFLLSSGRSSIVPHSGNVRLTSIQCLDFIASLDPNAIHVVYFGDYDFTKILEDLPFPKLERLMNRESRRKHNSSGVWPIDYGPYEIDYLPRKYFKVRKSGGPWIEISDVGSFFQCRFVEALEKWDIGTPEERELIAAGKDKRGNFEFSEIEEITEYNQLEIVLLAALMEKFRAACVESGVIPSRWQGPGLLAEALFSKYGVPPSRQVPLLNAPESKGLLEFARNAFYGGRPEIGVVGPVNRTVEQWDINSAYPHAMRFVPCLMHGKWSHETDFVPTAESVALCYGNFQGASTLSGNKPPQFYGLPTRTKAGTIVYPAAGQGWYWSFEIAAAIHQRFNVREAYVYHRECDCKPLDFVSAVYAERKKLGKDGAGIVLKLALNSLYGKTVQSIGSPKYANPIWGSFITAFCRTMIQQFMHSAETCPKWCGADVLMIATDSVCTMLQRDDIEESGELGGWSKELHPTGMFLVQPGLYFGSSDKPAKTRGVPRSAIAEREGDFRAAFQAMSESRNLKDGDLRVEQKMFVGVRYAIHRHDMRLLGQWINFVDPETKEVGKRITFDWDSKRAAWPVIEPLDGVQEFLRTYPQPGNADEVTLPYGKDIGGMFVREIQELFEAQPDWGADLLAGFAE